MKCSICIVALLMFANAAKSQGTFQISFDGPPSLSLGTGKVVQSYDESGVTFTAGTSDGFIRLWGDQSTPSFPNDGTAYIQASAGDSISFSFQTVFDLRSVDLSGYSTIVPNFSVDFLGILSGGGTVATNFSGTGIEFQTFKFGQEWSGLKSVEIPNDAWSLDNVVMSVPEPGSRGFFELAGLVFVFTRLRKRRLLPTI